MRILIVSEDPLVRLRAASALELHAEDVELTEATTSMEARSRVKSDGFDVLVVDGDMSPKGGFSFLYELREDAELEGTSTPPALVMMGREEDRWLAGWAGANEVMLKPVDPFTLARRVSELAGQEGAAAGARVAGDEVDAVLDADGDAGLNPVV